MSDLGWWNPSIYPIVATDGSNLKEEVNDGEHAKQSEHRERYLKLSFGFQLSSGWWFIAMPVRGPSSGFRSTSPPLMRMLADVVDAALKWESAHPGEVSTHQLGLTEKVDVINLISTGADPESRPEGDGK